MNDTKTMATGPLAAPLFGLRQVADALGVDDARGVGLALATHPRAVIRSLNQIGWRGSRVTARADFIESCELGTPLRLDGFTGSTEIAP